MPAALVSVRPGHLYLLPPRKKTCTESCLFVAFPAGFCYNDTKSRFHKHSEACKEKNEAYYARQKMLEEKAKAKKAMKQAGEEAPSIIVDNEASDNEETSAETEKKEEKTEKSESNEENTPD